MIGYKVFATYKGSELFNDSFLALWDFRSEEMGFLQERFRQTCSWPPPLGIV